MKTDYKTDRQWSDRFVPLLKLLIGQHLLTVASFEQDANQASDLVVFSVLDRRIACRVRRHGYADKYPFQFTVRSQRDTGSKTELEKIMEGFGDWFFYGHSSKTESGIYPWWLIDLNIFRTIMKNPLLSKSVLTGECPNGDGTWLRWYDVRTFPISVVIAERIE